MQEIVDVVLENDPEAIILLTSDHSARNMMSIETVDKSECFAAIYAPGIAEIEEEGIEGESVVNLLRKIVNYLFNMKMEMLERPSV